MIIIQGLFFRLNFTKEIYKIIYIIRTFKYGKDAVLINLGRNRGLKSEPVVII